MPIPRVDINRDKGVLHLYLHSDKVSDCKTYTTYNDWRIEANFLITFDSDGFKHAYRIPDSIRKIEEETDNDYINRISGKALGSGS